MTKDKEHDDVQRYYNRCRSEKIAADKERADKERDDELIAETNKNWQAAGVPLPYLDWFAREVLRLERSGWKPKPDRAEALAWMIEGLFAEAADNPCTCTSDENSCPHCNAWERATKQTRACIVEAIDELRTEWEAERPAVVVPEETGWLVETKFGPHIHYMGIKDPHPYWRESRKKDEEFEPYGRRALVGLLSFNKDSNDGLRFARKVDAEAFIAAFGQLMTDPKATEHIWADKHLIDGAKGGE